MSKQYFTNDTPPWRCCVCGKINTPHNSCDCSPPEPISGLEPAFTKEYTRKIGRSKNKGAK